MILMVQLRDRRIAGKDHESDAVITVVGILRDLTVYTWYFEGRLDPHFGRSSPIFGRNSPLFYPRV